MSYLSAFFDKAPKAYSLPDPEKEFVAKTRLKKVEVLHRAGVVFLLVFLSLLIVGAIRVALLGDVGFEMPFHAYLIFAAALILNLTYFFRTDSLRKALESYLDTCKILKGKK